MDWLKIVRASQSSVAVLATVAAEWKSRNPFPATANVPFEMATPYMKRWGATAISGNCAVSVCPLRSKIAVPPENTPVEFDTSMDESASSVTLPMLPQVYFVCVFEFAIVPPRRTTG